MSASLHLSLLFPSLVHCCPLKPPLQFLPQHRWRLLHHPQVEELLDRGPGGRGLWRVTDLHKTEPSTRTVARRAGRCAVESWTRQPGVAGLRTLGPPQGPGGVRSASGTSGRGGWSALRRMLGSGCCLASPGTLQRLIGDQGHRFIRPRALNTPKGAPHDGSGSSCSAPATGVLAGFQEGSSEAQDWEGEMPGALGVTAGVRGEESAERNEGKGGRTCKKQHREKESTAKGVTSKRGRGHWGRSGRSSQGAPSQGLPPAIPATRGLLYSKNIMEKSQMSSLFPSLSTHLQRSSFLLTRTKTTTKKQNCLGEPEVQLELRHYVPEARWREAPDLFAVFLPAKMGGRPCLAAISSQNHFPLFL